MTILIYPLDANEPPMFARTFRRTTDANDYVAFWRGIGSCRIVRRA